MPSKAKSKKGKIIKKTKEEELAELDALLNDEEFMKSIEDKSTGPLRKYGNLPQKTGAENARIGMEGFKAATSDPKMFEEAMAMLNDPSAVKEAQRMMDDPDFKKEIQKYMANMKKDPKFQTMLQEAQGKFQEIMKNPEMVQNLNGSPIVQTDLQDVSNDASGMKDVEVKDPGIDSSL